MGFVVLEKSNGKTTHIKENTYQDAKLHRILKDLPLQREVIPSMMVPVKELLRTVDGKIDRRALIRINLPNSCEGNRSGSPESADHTLILVRAELEKTWRLAISRLLELSHIGAETDSFSFGGNSVLLAQVKTLIRKASASTPTCLIDIGTQPSRAWRV